MRLDMNEQVWIESQPINRMRSVIVAKEIQHDW